ncbi:uncharacterized protein LOC133832658 [Humulus lupulus]|uniref:uncharacterized protein LOC133832658 n=1 Tax=Humulus lupulus TaxID=3486 RepID=UPI002B400BF0|nr:uncharacterized protein LOC133832658 [Humulus lupulus]
MHYIRDVPNGENYDRKWLVYSVSLDKVFCFCCKKFAKKYLVGLLVDEGINDWHNISDRFKSHELSKQHIESVASLVELEKRLKLKLTIDASLQEQVNQEKKHWKQVLERILAIVKRLGKNNLAFRGDCEKLYENNNGIFLQMIELLAEFDFTMQEHVHRILKASTKRWKVFIDHVPGLTVKTLSGSRWEIRVESVKAIRFQAPEIKEALNYLKNSKEDAKTKSDDETLSMYNILNFEFLLDMVIWYDLLCVVNNARKILQSKDMVAIKELKFLLSFLQKYREIGFEEAMIEATKIASKMEVEPVSMEK